MTTNNNTTQTEPDTETTWNAALVIVDALTAAITSVAVDLTHAPVENGRADARLLAEGAAWTEGGPLPAGGLGRPIAASRTTLLQRRPAINHGTLWSYNPAAGYLGSIIADTWLARFPTMADLARSDADDTLHTDAPDPTTLFNGTLRDTADYFDLLVDPATNKQTLIRACADPRTGAGSATYLAARSTIHMQYRTLSPQHQTHVSRCREVAIRTWGTTTGNPLVDDRAIPLAAAAIAAGLTTPTEPIARLVLDNTH